MSLNYDPYSSSRTPLPTNVVRSTSRCEWGDDCSQSELRLSLITCATNLLAAETKEDAELWLDIQQRVVKALTEKLKEAQNVK